MNYYLPFFIGLRYSRSKRNYRFVSLISFFSMLGIALGVCVLITVLSVMNGFDEEIEQRVFDLAPHILITNADFKEEKIDWLKKQIFKIHGVDAIAPYIHGKGLIRENGVLRPIMIQGILPSEEIKVSHLQNHIYQGKLNALKQGTFGVIIGNKLSNELGIGLGDKLIMMIPEVKVSPVGLMPRYKRFQVVGIFQNAGGLGFESHYAFIHLKDAQTLYELTDSISGIRLRTESLYVAPKIAETLRTIFPESYYISDWTDQYGPYLQAIKLEKTMMMLILFLLIVIAVFNLISSLVMLVNEKQSDIAILRTMGARPATILSVFIVQGCMVGIIGTLLGVIAGIILAYNVTEFVEIMFKFVNLRDILSAAYLVDHLPSKILISDIVITVSISLFLSFIATIYPSLRAAKLHPVQILRYE